MSIKGLFQGEDRSARDSGHNKIYLFLFYVYEHWPVCVCVCVCVCAHLRAPCEHSAHRGQKGALGP